MKIVTATIAALWLCLSFANAAHAAAEFRGSWTLAQSRERGKVQFGLTHKNQGGGFSQHESDWPASAFNGLDLTTGGKHDVSFVIDRDAGRIECNGFIEGGEGSGSFTFKLSEKYLESMRSLGYGEIDENKQFVMAVHDITVDFARAMKGENLRNFDVDKLVAFGLFDVDQAFIHALRAEGLAADDADKLIAFRVHQVSPEFVAIIADLGYQHPAPEQLVALRVHEVTPEYITALKSRGMKNLTIDQLVSLKIHGID